MYSMEEFSSRKVCSFFAWCCSQPWCELGNDPYTSSQSQNLGGIREFSIKSMKIVLRKTIGKSTSLKVDLAACWIANCFPQYYFHGFDTGHIGFEHPHQAKKLHSFLEEVSSIDSYTTICQIGWTLNSCHSHNFLIFRKIPRHLHPLCLSMDWNISQLPLVVEPVRCIIIEECFEKRFKYVSKHITDFWKQWSKKYLTTLIIRPKNKTEHPDLFGGDLVFITEDNLPPLHWPIGVIENAYTENDNLVRVAKVKASENKSVIKAITKPRELPIKKNQPQPSNASPTTNASSSWPRCSWTLLFFAAWVVCQSPFPSRFLSILLAQ